ncbi:MAG: DUF3793 family protein [Geobacteraceae bacterium]|nr:DUF3793 family protein [Geobacteraceae bacterium]
MTSFASTPITNGDRKPVWMDLAGRFPDDRDCLAAFLAFETAEVLDGIKPSSLVNLLNRPRRCGKNLHAVWKEHGEGIIRKSPLEAKVMVERSDSLLLLLYDQRMVSELLENRGVRALLRRSGYTPENGVDGLLSELARRFASGSVPHEIGIILGYPLKDVAGFMGVGHLRFTCQGPWRIFGNPQRSLMLAEAHRQCHCRMAVRLMAGTGPFECLGISGGASDRKKVYFYPHDENDNQNHKGGTPCVSH